MSQQEDLLFCKLAIQTGLATPDDAKRCLGYLKKLDAAGKKRPEVGVIFLKTKLLSEIDVAKLNQAVAKRSAVKDTRPKKAREAESRTAHRSRSRGVEKSAPPGQESARPGRGRPTKRQVKPAAPRRKVAPKTLMLGAGSAIVLLGALGGMLFLLFRNVPEATPEAGARTQTSRAGVNAATSDVIKNRLLAGGSDRPGADAEAVEPFTAAEKETFIAEHRSAILHSRGAMRAADPEKALAYLKRFKSENAKYYSHLSDSAREIDDEIASLEEMVEGS